MKFKTTQIERDFRCTEGLTLKQQQLREYADLIDRLSTLSGHGEITITDMFRYGDRWIHSLHHRNYGKAVDIRVKDKTAWWYAAMAMLGYVLNELNPKFRMNPHWELHGTDDAHIHIEIRN